MWLAFACVAEVPERSLPELEPAPGPSACPDPGPAPEAAAWSPTGAAYAGALSTIAGNVGVPVYVGSSLAGMWRLDALTDREFRGVALPDTTHTLGDLVVDPADPLRVYRSSGGTVHRSDDGGQSWEVSPFGSRERGAEFPGHVYGIGVPTGIPDRLYALLDTGVFGVSADAGVSWQARGLVPVEGEADTLVDYFRRFRIVAGATAADAILVHDGRTLFRSLDEGATWTAVLADVGRPEALARDPAAPDRVRLGAWTSDDGGATWSEGALDVELAAWSAALYTVGSDDVLTVTDTDGSRSVALPTEGTRAAVGFGQHVFVVDDSSIWHSADGGGSFARYEHSNIEKNLSVVEPDPSCPGVVWAGTRCDSGLYRSDDWGDTWQNVAAHGHYVMDIVFDPARPERVWLVNDDALLRSDDRGATWAHVWQAYHFHGFALDPEVPGRMLLGSVGSGDYADSTGQVYVSVDDGASFLPTGGLPPNAASAHSLAFVGGDVVFLGTYKAGDASHLSGQGIGLWRSADRGLTWARVDLDVADVARVTVANGVIWVATDRGVYSAADQGESWIRALEGTFRWVEFDGERGLALEGDGTVFVTEDGGGSWTVDHPASDPSDPWTLDNPLTRVALAPGGSIAWWARYGFGIDRRTFAP
ncbi:MAG: hypothetical protein EXR71_20425 [Myxococcales bacterium]|nr:hypothetical protein [Myxococcales bacterium]